MAHRAYKVNGAPVIDGGGGYIEYTVDFVSDIEALPTGPEGGEQYIAEAAKYPAPGSIAIVGATGDIYQLTPAREWKCISLGGV